MKVLDIITEAFEYNKYLPKIRKVVKDAFQSASKEDYGIKAQINFFLNEIRNELDEQVMDDILKRYPMTIAGRIPIRTLSASFKPEYFKQEEIPFYATHIKKQADWIRTNVFFVREADFHMQADAKHALINMEVDATALAKYLFQQQDPKIITASLDAFTNNLIGKLFHEVKHHVQRTKTAHMGILDVNKFYTGNPEDPNNARKQYKTKAGYWLNADEIDAWATTIASEIHNIYKDDMTKAGQYLNAVAQGKQIPDPAGFPASTALNHYRNVLFNKRTKTNTDKTVIWRRILKKVYKELGQFQNPA